MPDYTKVYKQVLLHENKISFCVIGNRPQKQAIVLKKMYSRSLRGSKLLLRTQKCFEQLASLNDCFKYLYHHLDCCHRLNNALNQLLFHDDGASVGFTCTFGMKKKKGFLNYVNRMQRYFFPLIKCNATFLMCYDNCTMQLSSKNNSQRGS